MTPWTAAHEAPPPMGFPRQEYWSGLPFPPPGDLPDPGVTPESPAEQVDSLVCSYLGTIQSRPGNNMELWEERGGNGDVK